MKIICKKNKNIDFKPLVLPEKLNQNCDEVVTCDVEPFGGSFDGFDITIDKEYDVFSILIYDNDIRCLIQNDSNIPEFHSIRMFDVINDELPFDLCIKKYYINGKLLTIIGYKEIIEYSKLIDLIRLTPNSIEEFNAYKKILYFKNLFFFIMKDLSWSSIYKNSYFAI